MILQCKDYSFESCIMKHDERGSADTWRRLCVLFINVNASLELANSGWDRSANACDKAKGRRDERGEKRRRKRVETGTEREQGGRGKGRRREGRE